MHNKNITTYKAHEKRRMSPLKVVSTIASNLIAYRDLAFILFKRDFFMAYKRSFFGYAWLFFSPIFAALSWVIMSKIRVLMPNVSGVSFTAYLLTGISLWLFFNSVYGQVSNALDSNRDMMTKVKYPHEVIIFSQTLKACMNFSIAYIVNLLIIGLIFGVKPNLYWILAPFYTIPLILLAVGLGSIFMIIKFTVPDLEKTFATILPMFMFITPIIYSMDGRGDSKLWLLVEYNPLTYLIGYPKELILFGHTSLLIGYLYASLGSLLFAMWALNIFFISEEVLIEKIY